MLSEALLRNREGLTWCEWLATATISKKVSEINRETMREMRSEWRTGVDPTEWALLFSKGLKG